MKASWAILLGLIVIISGCTQALPETGDSPTNEPGTPSDNTQDEPLTDPTPDPIPDPEPLPEPAPEPLPDNTTNTTTDPEPAPSTFTVTMDSSGFTPSTLTVQAGDIVIFTNADTRAHWPATDNHPSHTFYPGSSISQCGTGAIMFDSCEGVAPGESWVFIFTEIGSWDYHDHLKPAFIGTIVVQ